MYLILYIFICISKWLLQAIRLEVSSRIDINHHWSSSNGNALTLQKYALENNIDGSWA